MDKKPNNETNHSSSVVDRESDYHPFDFLRVIVDCPRVIVDFLPVIVDFLLGLVDFLDDLVRAVVDFHFYGQCYSVNGIDRGSHFDALYITK